MGFERVDIQVLEILTGCGNFPLHGAKALLEFPVGPCKRLLRIDPEMPCQVDDR